MRIRPNLTTALLALGLAAYPFAAVADSTAIEPAGCDLTDATPCLQAAIDRAAASGVSVFIPAGTYALRTNLTLRTGVAIAGDAGALILPGPNNWSDPVLVSGDGISRVTISGLAFEGGGAAFANASALINLTNTTDVLFDHISIRHVRGKAITTVGSGPGSSARNGITNSILDDIGNHWKKSHQRGDRDMAVTFWGRTDGAGTGNFARANRFTDVGLDALQITGQDGFVAEGNVFELWNNQIKLLPSGDYPAAIFTTRATHVTIASNTIHQAVGNGIDAPGLTNSVIENNTIRECGQSGIGLFRNYDGDERDAGGVTIRGNTIENNAIWAASTWRASISIGGGRPTGIRISANTITDTRPKGLKTQDYGIDVVNANGISTRPKDLVIDADNILKGNQRGATHGV